jgi:hypothetical protein
MSIVKRIYNGVHGSTDLENGKKYLMTSDGAVVESIDEQDVVTQTDKLLIPASKADPRYVEILERNIVMLMQGKMDKSNIQPIIDAIDSQGLVSTLRYQLPQPAVKIAVGDWVVGQAGGYVKARADDLNKLEVLGLCTAATATTFDIVTIGMTSYSLTAPNGSLVYLGLDGSMTTTKPTSGIIKKLGNIHSNKVIVDIAPTIKLSVDSITTVPTAIRSNLDNQVVDKLKLAEFDSAQFNITIKGDNFVQSTILHVVHDGNGQAIDMSVISDRFSGIDVSKKSMFSAVKNGFGEIEIRITEARIGVVAKVRRILF